MTPTDLHSQLTEERSALTTKTLGLLAFINHPDHAALSQTEQEMLAQQLQVMTAYQLILASRIKFYKPDGWSPVPATRP